MPRSISNIKLKGLGRRGKCPRMTKEGPKLLGGIAEDRHVLGEMVSWKERTIHHPKQPSPSFPNERTSVGGQLWEHGERAIVKEPVTSALNARSGSLVALMKEWPLNSVTLSTATHSKLREALDGTDIQVTTCMINRWTTKIKGAEGYITRETSWRGGIVVRKTPESSSRDVSEEEKKNSSSDRLLPLLCPCDDPAP